MRLLVERITVLRDRLRDLGHKIAPWRLLESRSGYMTDVE